MSMKQVRELIEKWEQPCRCFPDDVSIKELKAAIAPDWKPASEPPDTSRYVWVMTVSNEKTMATYSGSSAVWVHWSTGAIMGGVNEVAMWHEIEVPEPPEVPA